MAPPANRSLQGLASFGLHSRMGRMGTGTTIPDWVRRGIRLGIALGVFSACGQGLIVPTFIPPDLRLEFKRSAAWAGITCIVVNAPFLGRVAQTGTERTLGTMAGGALGYVVYDLGSELFTNPWLSEAFLVCAAGVVGILSCYLTVALKLDMMPRFFALTYVLVTFGAPSYSSALRVAVLRTSAILAGVALMQVLAVIILPRSASVEAFRDIRRALKAMCDLSDIVWASHPLSAPASADGKPMSPDMTVRLQRFEAADITVHGRNHNHEPRIPPAHAHTPGTADGGTDDEHGGVPVSLPMLSATLGGDVDGGVAHGGAECQDEGAGTGGDVEAGEIAGAGDPSPSPAAAARRERRGSWFTWIKRVSGRRGDSPTAQDALQQPLLDSDDSSGAAKGPPEAAPSTGNNGRTSSSGGMRRTASYSVLRSTSSFSVRKRAADCEKALAAIYSAQAACEDNLTMSAAEIYLWHFWGHYLFAPGFPNLGRLYSRTHAGTCGSWHLQPHLVTAVLDSVRRLSRLLWNTHLSLSEFTPEIQALVEVLYPEGLLRNLADAFGLALRELRDAFPGDMPVTGGTGLPRLAELLVTMQAASDAQHRLLVDRLMHTANARALTIRSLRRNTTVLPSPPMLTSVVANLAAGYATVPSSFGGRSGSNWAHSLISHGVDTAAPPQPHHHATTRQHSFDPHAYAVHNAAAAAVGHSHASPDMGWMWGSGTPGWNSPSASVTAPRTGVQRSQTTPACVRGPTASSTSMSAQRAGHRPDASRGSRSFGPGPGDGGGLSAAAAAPGVDGGAPDPSPPGEDVFRMDAELGGMAHVATRAEQHQHQQHQQLHQHQGRAGLLELPSMSASLMGDDAVTTPCMSPAPAAAPHGGDGEGGVQAVDEGAAPVVQADKVAALPPRAPRRPSHAAYHPPALPSIQVKTISGFAARQDGAAHGGGGGGQLVSSPGEALARTLSPALTDHSDHAATFAHLPYSPGGVAAAGGHRPQGPWSNLRRMSIERAALGAGPGSSPRDDPGQLAHLQYLFASTPEGHIAQVRWASFEWQMDQLGDELEELYEAAAALAATLPYPL